MGRSKPFCAWDKINATGTFVASVIRMNWVLKSGYARTCSVQNASLRFSNSSCWRDPNWTEPLSLLTPLAVSWSQQISELDVGRTMLVKIYCIKVFHVSGGAVLLNSFDVVCGGCYTFSWHFVTELMYLRRRIFRIGDTNLPFGNPAIHAPTCAHIHKWNLNTESRRR
jgi:hypothetical protein